jgi:hypothetical protein
MVGGKFQFEEGEQLGQLLGEVVDRGLLTQIAAQLIGLDGAAAGRPADVEVDAPRMEGMPHAEGLGHPHRAVMRQQRFAETYRIPLPTLKNWEQGRRAPDAPAAAYLQAISRQPKAIEEALRQGLIPIPLTFDL